MKKGFTLLELLAVIVVLAIIALIITPFVAKAINEAKKGSFRNSAYGMITSAESFYAQKMVKNDFSETIISINEGIPSLIDFKYHGSKINKAYIQINEQGKVRMYMWNNGYCATKTFEDEDVTVTEKPMGECSLEGPNPPVIDASTGECVANSKTVTLTDIDGTLTYKYYLSTSSDALVDGSWLDVVNGEMTIETEGINYLYLKSIKDGLDSSLTGPIEICIDNAYYTITINNEIGGTVTADKLSAQIGETVTLTPHPDENYDIAAYTINNINNIENTFLMPEGNTVVQGLFYKQNYENNDNSPITFITPVTGYYKVELWGAQGGGENGGKGGYSKGNIYMEEGEVYYLYVGQQGITNGTAFNGGGGRGTTTVISGGGATDVRCFVDANGKCVENTNSLEWSNDLGLNSRIMVASGGSGNYNVIYGTVGGELVGNTGICYHDGNTNCNGGGGGTQTSGGRAGGCDIMSRGEAGSFGFGGVGNAVGGISTSVGGGGGYYGGGGGCIGARIIGGGWVTVSSAGGSGSSYISGHLGSNAIVKQDSPGGTRTSKCAGSEANINVFCSYHYSNKIFVNTAMLAGNQVMPTHDASGTMNGNAGNGYAKITYESNYMDSKAILADGSEITYDSINKYKTLTVENTGYYQVELWGAQGGGTTGGTGGYTKGSIYMEEGEVYYLYVGQQGITTGAAFNGGGGPGISTVISGGGATDLRCFVDENGKCVEDLGEHIGWQSDLGLNSRIMVAGGGSGGYSYSDGIVGGELVGNAGRCHHDGNTNCNGGGGGTQTSGGRAGGCDIMTRGGDGSFGFGGVGNAVQGNGTLYTGGGGGGGYYGGGGGCVGERIIGGGPVSVYSVGGGGTSYVSGYQGCVAIAKQETPGEIRTPRTGSDAITQCTLESAASDIVCSYHYSGKIFTNITVTAGINNGHGKARILYLGPSLD